MTTNMTLRLPPNLAATLNQIAANDGLSRHGLIIQILTEATARDDDLDPALIIGYIPLASGELDTSDCPECYQPLTNPHIGFTVGAQRPVPFGPICALCATTQ